MSPTPHQTAILDRAERIARSGMNAPPGLLLVGPRGCGKRTMAQQLSGRLGAEFVRVPLSEPVDAVRTFLVGPPSAVGLSGLFGIDRPTVLYLDQFHALSAGDLRLLVQQAVERRTYTAANGNHYKLSPELFIVAGLRHPEPDAVLTLTASICAEFRRVDVSVPMDEAELVTLAAEMLDRVDPGRRFAADAGPVVREAANGSDGLHTLNNWLHEAVKAHDGPVSATVLRAARDRDVQFHLNRIVYRGRRLTLDGFRRWQNQFPADLLPVTVDLVRHIATRYYLSDARYWDLLDNLLEAAAFRQHEPVVFCQWQPIGKSGPVLLHDLKNRCRFDPQPHLDVTGPPERWQRVAHGSPLTFVFVDDFVGTGRTICSLWEEGERSLIRLLGEYTGSRAVVLSLVALRSGEQRVQESLVRAKLTVRVQVCIGARFQDSDRCLSDGSTAIPDPDARNRLRRFCETECKKVFPKKYRFGYEDSQSLVVFPNAVPNNSLAILWYERNGWVPLLPGSGRLEEPSDDRDEAD